LARPRTALLGAGGRKQIQAALLAKKVQAKRKRSLAAEDAERVVRVRKQDSGGFYCRAKGCNRWFRTEKWLGKHQKKLGQCPDAGTCAFRSSGNSGKKNSGVTPAHVSARDLMKRIIVDTSKAIRGASATHVPGSAAALLADEIGMVTSDRSMGDGQYHLIDGSTFNCPAAPVGMAEKKKAKGSVRLTVGQLNFLHWSYMRGEHNKANKMSPKQAADAMESHGTAAGARRFPDDKYCERRSDNEPTFRIGELLEHWTFRSWFGQQKSAFQKKIDTNKKNAPLNFAELVVSRANGDVGEDDDEEAE
jgi:hypothetical protein